MDRSPFYLPSFFPAGSFVFFPSAGLPGWFFAPFWGGGGGDSLLVAKDHGADVYRVAGAAVGGDHFSGIQSHVFPAVPAGLSWHAAPLPRLSAGISGAERHVHRRRFDPGRRVCNSADLSHLV